MISNVWKFIYAKYFLTSKLSSLQKRVLMLRGCGLDRIVELNLFVNHLLISHFYPVIPTKCVNEERVLFSTTNVQVVRSAINPPPASADENVLMSRSNRLTKFCIFNISRIWNRDKAALAALTNDISTTTWQFCWALFS